MKHLALTVLTALSLLSFKAYSERIVSIDGQELEQTISRISFVGDTAILHLPDGDTISTNCLLLKIEFNAESDLPILQNTPVLLARNPVSERLQLENLEVGSTLMLYDAEGRLLKKQKARSGSEQIDLSNLPSGIYMLKAGKYLLRFIKQ